MLQLLQFRKEYRNVRALLGPAGSGGSCKGFGNIPGIFLWMLEGTETVQMAETSKNWHKYCISWSSIQIRGCSLVPPGPTGVAGGLGIF